MACDTTLDFFIKFLNCLKFNGCNGSTFDFLGLECISIINPSHPAAIEANVKLGTHGAQKEAWLGSEIIGNLDISFKAGIAWISKANLEVALWVWGIDIPLSHRITFSLFSLRIYSFIGILNFYASFT